MGQIAHIAPKVRFDVGVVVTGDAHGGISVELGQITAEHHLPNVCIGFDRVALLAVCGGGNERRVERVAPYLAKGKSEHLHDASSSSKRLVDALHHLVTLRSGEE